MKLIRRPFVFVGNWVKRHWILSIILLIIFGGAGFFVYTRTNKAPEKLTFVPVTQDKLVKTLNVSGIIDAKQKATLHYSTGGKITYVGAQEGDIVKKNQTLARLDSRDLQKRLQADLNNYFTQRLTFDQNADDRGDTITSQAIGRQVQQDQNTLNNSVIDVEVRDIAIQNATLTTPIAGILVSAPTTVAGVVLGPTDIFEVIDPRSLVFKAAVDETDIPLVKRGQTASIQLDAYPEDPLSASVSAIAYRSAQTSKGTVFVVELPIPIISSQSAAERYRLGMNGDTDIVVDQRENVLQIPVDALTERDGKKFAKKKTGENTAQEVEIKTGIENETMIEVTDGLQLGDQVVLP